MNAPILVLANLPETSEATARVAAALGAPLQLPLVLLHLDVYPVMLEPELVAAAAEQTTRNEAETMAGLHKLAQRLPVPTAVAESAGIMADAVAEAVAQYQPLLLAMGLSPEHDLLDHLLHNQVLPVLRGTHRPLLLVPTGAIARAPRRVLVAVDGEPFTPTAVALALAPLLASWEAAFTVAHVRAHHPPLAAPGNMARVDLQTSGLLPPGTVPALYEECHVSPGAGVLQAIDDTAADLIVLLARPRSFLERQFRRSVTAQVLRHSRVPVLLLPAEASEVSGWLA